MLDFSVKWMAPVVLLGLMGCPPTPAHDAGTPDAGIEDGSPFVCRADAVKRQPPASPELVWTSNSTLMISSSPRVTDINGDGVGDIVLGRGALTGAIAALDGVTGQQLWLTETDADLFTSALLVKLDGDDVFDAVVGGRGTTLLAVSGATGTKLWQFDGGATPHDAGWFDFFSAQSVGDLTGDGVPDLLVANGGDSSVQPFEPRAPNHLALMNGATGEVISRALTPDLAETYMSPVLTPAPGDAGSYVIFGSGGETLPGSLWRATLADVQRGDLSTATQLVAPISNKGVMAPPSLVDLTRDGVADIVVSTFDGRLIALDGVTGATLWSMQTAGSEAYASPAIGYFDDDDVPDVAAAFMLGVWDHYTGSRVLAVSGSDGGVLSDVTVGGKVLSSPVAIDIHGHGRDAFIYLSAANPDAGAVLMNDLETGTTTALAVLPRAAFGTPWVGDLDCDGVIDLVYSRRVISGETVDSGVDSEIIRLRLNAVAPARAHWGAYLGTSYDGHF